MYWDFLLGFLFMKRRFRFYNLYVLIFIKKKYKIFTENVPDSNIRKIFIQKIKKIV